MALMNHDHTPIVPSLAQQVVDTSKEFFEEIRSAIVAAAKSAPKGKKLKVSSCDGQATRFLRRRGGFFAIEAVNDSQTTMVICHFTSVSPSLRYVDKDDGRPRRNQEMGFHTIMETGEHHSTE